MTAHTRCSDQNLKMSTHLPVTKTVVFRVELVVVESVVVTVVVVFLSKVIMALK